MNDVHDIENRVRDILAEVLEVAARDLEDEPTLAAHGWDSLSTLHALAELEEQLGGGFDLREIQAVDTVGDMVAVAAGVAAL